MDIKLERSHLSTYCLACLYSMLYIWRHANRVEQFQKHDALSIVLRKAWLPAMLPQSTSDEKEARRNVYGICVPEMSKCDDEKEARNIYGILTHGRTIYIYRKIGPVVRLGGLAPARPITTLIFLFLVLRTVV